MLATLTTSQTLATVSQPGYYDHQTVSVTLPGNLAPGTYYIGGIANYNNQVSESNTTNNTYNVVQITVTAPPQPGSHRIRRRKQYDRGGGRQRHHRCL